MVKINKIESWVLNVSVTLPFGDSAPPGGDPS